MSKKTRSKAKADEASSATEAVQENSGQGTEATGGVEAPAEANGTAADGGDAHADGGDADDRDATIDALRRDLMAVNERWLRKVAEFDNFRRRTAREAAELSQRVVERAATALLPALDDLERMRALPAEQATADALGKGVDMVIEKFRSGLDALGVRPFESVGQPFDPERHDALTTQSVEGREDNEVLEEFLRGYRVGERVMRHAQVIVNRR